MVTKLGHHDLRDQRFGRQTTGHDMFRGMGLDHRPRAAPTSVFRTAGDEHTELGGHDIEPFGDILADPGHLAATAGAERGLRFDDPLDPRQMFREMTAVAIGLAALAGSLASRAFSWAASSTP